MVRLVRVLRAMIQMVGDRWLLALVWSVLVHSLCSGVFCVLRDSLDYLVSEYLGFHGSFDDSQGIYAYTH